MKQELAQATQNWLLIPQEAKALIERSQTLLDRKDIGNNRMSPYQLENFVLDEEHQTDWGKYKQAIAEIESRISILMSDHVQYRKAIALRTQAQWKADKLWWISWIGYYQAERDIQLAEADLQSVTLAATKRHIEHCLLELKTFEGKAQLHYDQCEGRSVIELEQEYWVARKEYFEKKKIEAITENVFHSLRAQMATKEALQKNGGG